MRPAPALTPLQLAAQCAASCMQDAREQLDAEAWDFFIGFLTALVAREESKILFRELRRAE